MTEPIQAKEAISKTLIEGFLKDSRVNTNANVSSEAIASNSGLDSKTKDVLNFIHSFPPVYELDLELVRKPRNNPFGHDLTNDVTELDITIPCKGRDLPARVYRPQNTENEILPALIYFHGGGFVLGDIESHDKMLAQLCSQSTVAIISVAYRLAPETVFPGAVEDTQESVDWIAKHSAQLNIDPTRIAVGGDSAGANLATVYCHLNRDRRDFTPYFQILIYPSIIGNDTSVSRKLFSENLLLTKELLKWFHQLYISKNQENDPRFNVINASDFSNLPPAYVLTCGFDPLRDEGLLYANKLIESGVPVKHSCYTDMFHGFINYGVLQQSKDAVTECAMILNGVMNLK
jgi:acetyl esterase